MMTPIKNASLRFRLIVVISLTAVMIWAVSTAVAWFQASDEVNEVFDAQQILFAEQLASSDLHKMLIERPRNTDKKWQKKLKRLKFDDDALAFAVFSADGEIVLSDEHNGQYFNYAPKFHKFSNARLNNDDDDEWRIFWLPVAQGRLVIAVGQEIDYRDDLIEAIILSQLWIWLASLPLLLTLIVWIINRELKTLKEVSRQLKQRMPEDHQRLSTNVPSEILPLVNSLNQFFERTATMLLRERRFTSDAAHELRSPLAALKIQTEIAQIAGEDNSLRENALQNLTLGIDRATQLIEQLLTLSRLDNLTELADLEQVNWQNIITSVISELYFPAQKRGIELAFNLEGTPPCRQGQPLLLSLMLRNLIDNAIKYCPQGTMVKVSLTSQAIIVEDNGGGVDEADLEKLGQRFYRPAGQNEKGSGLGLSIVHRIAELHHSRIHLQNYRQGDGHNGLKITISW